MPRRKTLPATKPVTFSTAALLLVLGVMVVAAPERIPGLALPDETMPMPMP